MANAIQLFPELEDQEMAYVQALIKDFTDDQAKQFALGYRGRRKDPMLILLTCCIGFVGFAGIHRFIINHIGLGLIYLLTGGICLIGTVIDIINYKNLAFEYNSAAANRVAQIVRSTS